MSLGTHQLQQGM